VVGCKLGEIATKRYTVPPAGVPIIHLDIVAEEFGRTTEPAVALWGDARSGLDDLLERCATRPRAFASGNPATAVEIGQRMAAWRESAQERYTSQEAPVSMGRLMGELTASAGRRHPGRDGGFAAHWGGLLYDTMQAGPRLRPGPRLRLDRLRAARRHGGGAGGGTRPPVVSLTGDGGFT
jgi:acetolactate synthase-1/2/3 large subunit